VTAPFFRPFALAGLALLAACAQEPPPPPPLPAFADLSLERECRCVTAGECTIPEAFEGQGETRGFRCTWADRATGRADCTYEGRSRPDDPPGSRWSSWSRSTVRLRHLGARGWCWFERGSENELTDGPPFR
jgi:hypothetical protein